jgi:hypothetical protein
MSGENCVEESGLGQIKDTSPTFTWRHWCKSRTPLLRTDGVPMNQPPLTRQVRHSTTWTRLLSLVEYSMTLIPSAFPISSTLLRMLREALFLCMWPFYVCVSSFFLWWRAPQQMLRTHRSLKAYCTTLWWRWRERWSLPSATLSTSNHTWTDPGSNPGFRGGRPATNRLSHGTAPCVSSYFSHLSISL